MSAATSYNYLEEYIDALRSKGIHFFTYPELKKIFGSSDPALDSNHALKSDQALKKALQRLKSKKKIALVRKGFYVILSPEYRDQGILPPASFVPDLMNFLGRDYYIGLQSAAAFYIAADQQTREYFVVTEKPVLRPVDSGELKMVFCHRTGWPAGDIVNTKTETGYANISTPELTALDLVNYSDWIEGGFNRIAAILEELTDELNPQKLAATAERYGRIATAQRVGFILDIFLGQKELTIPLLKYLRRGNYFPVLLKPQKTKPGNRITGNPWKVIENIEMEMSDKLSGQWEW